MSRFPPNIAASAIRWIGAVETQFKYTDKREIAAICRAIIDRAMVLSTASRFEAQPTIDLLLKTSLEHLGEGDNLMLALSKLPATVPEFAELRLRFEAMQVLRSTSPLTPEDFK